MPFIDPEPTVRKLQDMGARKILLQLPDGLKPHVFDYFSALSREFTVIVSSQPFYGACDIGNREVYDDVDCIVQFGHSRIPNVDYPKPMIFEEYQYQPVSEFREGLFAPLKEKGYLRVGLLSSIQYMETMEPVRKKLAEEGFEVFIGRNDSRINYPGQVLGCNFSSAHSVSEEVDCFLVISTGKFHSMGVQLTFDLETFVLDLNEMNVTSLKEESDRLIRRRYAVMAKALDARKFCVVMNTKIGQRRSSLTNFIARKVRELGNEAVIVTSDEVNPSDCQNMKCDAIVFTGCPRVPVDDWEKFTVPILTPPEFLQIFGFKKTNRYIMDEIVAVD